MTSAPSSPGGGFGGAPTAAPQRSASSTGVTSWKAATEAGFVTSETELDETVRQAGGEREDAVVDLRKYPSYLWRRLTRRRPEYSDAVYFVPSRSR